MLFIFVDKFISVPEVVVRSLVVCGLLLLESRVSEVAVLQRETLHHYTYYLEPLIVLSCLNPSDIFVKSLFLNEKR